MKIPPTFRRGSVAAAMFVFAAACSDDVGGTSTPPPSVAARNAPRAATVGVAFEYDAAQAGATFDDAELPFTYTITFPKGALGLTADGSTVSGTPNGIGIVSVRIDGEDAFGRIATDTFSIAVFSASLTTPTLPLSLYNYSDATLPPHYTGASSVMPQHDNTPAGNPTTNAGVTLGRVLFYDKRLSINDQVACASCHLQEFGFSDTALKSRGFAGGFTGRHSMGLSNARYYQRGNAFWDERAATLEAQALKPIADPVEMGLPLADAVTKLSVTAYYRALFTAAFGDSVVTTTRIARALAQFDRALVSHSSPFDAAYNGGETFDAQLLTQQQRDGLTVFQNAGCSVCHMTMGQIASEPRNIGLDATVTDPGAGNGKFKVPSLRNIAVRAPYMHDARFATLMDVVNFYNAGVAANPFLDDALRVSPGGAPRQLNLSLADKNALVAFLQSLTDPAFLADVRFSNPFGN
ncbi:MAG TPA: cytochrome c peroxidase [Gemmatimonadaceae bacterium]|nr:cytochrome c peroxidase [Gemmatimonadaceae bacterium]